jgi:periplasmic glucans biosynthesis protein
VPTVWVEPRGQWPEGEVHLVELPAAHEGDDNIAVFWKPATAPEAQQPYRFAYTLNWTGAEPHSQLPLLRVEQTRSGADPRDGSKRQFVVDFVALTNSAPAEVSPTVRLKDGSGASVSDVQVFKNEPRNGWRVFFSIKPDPATSGLIDILCSLNTGEKPVSELWNYLWNPSLSMKNTPPPGPKH